MIIKSCILLFVIAALAVMMISGMIRTDRRAAENEKRCNDHGMAAGKRNQFWEYCVTDDGTMKETP
jgi:hypothetical protein